MYKCVHDYCETNLAAAKVKGAVVKEKPASATAMTRHVHHAHLCFQRSSECICLQRKVQSQHENMKSLYC